MRPLAVACVAVFVLGCVVPRLPPLTKVPEWVPAEPPAPPEALVYFYRPCSPPWLFSAELYLNETKVCDLKNRGYTYVYLPPGEYAVRTKWPGGPGASNVQGKFGVRAGQTQFIRVDNENWVLLNVVKWRSTLTSVGEKVATFEIKECNYIEPTVKRYPAPTAARASTAGRLRGKSASLRDQLGL